ncbi:hypothetical protein QNN00_25610 [Bacillus velezensis]|nr:hypothetical protein [Bacillus velezensis]
MKEKFISISIICGYLCFLYDFYGPESFFRIIPPQAEQGVINLEKWDFQKDGNVQLNGKWILYPNQMLSPQALHSSKGKNPVLVDVPVNVKLFGKTADVDYGRTN